MGAAIFCANCGQTIRAGSLDYKGDTMWRHADGETLCRMFAHPDKRLCKGCGSPPHGWCESWCPEARRLRDLQARPKAVG